MKLRIGLLLVALVVGAGITLGATFGVAALSVSTSEAQPQSLPLLSIDDLDYTGAFRLEVGTFGASGSGYGPGVIGLGEGGDSLFVVGNPQVSAVAQYPIVEASTATTLAELPLASPPLQPFTRLLDRVPGGNPQSLDRVGGLIVVDGALVVNGYEYYDAPADNTHTTLSIADSDDLSSSTVTGWGELGGAAHASGWISSVPAEWQGALGGTHISGNSSGVPINGRSSMGPSAFAVNLDPSLSSVSEAEALLDFDLGAPLAADLANESLANDLWTHLSRATYGVIIEGTRTYLTLGQSGGHESGVSYGVPPWGGNSGYYSNDREDRSAWFWLWDVDDFIAVRAGSLAANAVRPYASGPFEAPFTGRDTRLGGATWDSAKGRLYVALAEADSSQSVYERPPLILTYEIDVDSDGSEPVDSVDVTHAISCLAGLGRIDTLIVNNGEAPARYRIEFEGLTAREYTVEQDGWWRMPITGRFDGEWDLTVRRDGVVESSRTVELNCQEQTPQLDDPAIRIVSACRAGRGYVLFQFVNPTSASRSWLIEFETVANRSTTAAGFGQAIRAVTGRSSGDYGVVIRSGGAAVYEGSVTVDCR